MKRVPKQNAAPIAAAPDDDAPRWDEVRSEAARLAPGHFGTLRWIDERCVKAGMHALAPWWLDTFETFYASGKLILAGRVGLRGGKSVSVVRSLVNDILFTRRELDPGVVGVVPILSANRTEATDRFVTLKRILLACGVAAEKEAAEGDALPGGLGGTFVTTTTPAGGGLVRVTDSQGHVIEARVYPATKQSAIGFTGVGAFCDEVDMWRDVRTAANPADDVLDLLSQRFTTTLATSRLYIFSASYGSQSAHSRVMDKGDTDLQHVARLGVSASESDTLLRRNLATAKGLSDTRLTAPSNPASVDVPAWISNPKAPIEACFALSRDVGEMLQKFGGRPDGAFGGAIGWEPIIGPPPLGSLVVGPAERRDDPSVGFTMTAADLARIASRRVY